MLTAQRNISVPVDDVFRNGKLLAYAIQHGGADETSEHILNVVTGKTMEDALPSARYTSIAFAPDGASLYYARNNREGTLLYQHVLGTAIRRTSSSSAASFAASC